MVGDEVEGDGDRRGDKKGGAAQATKISPEPVAAQASTPDKHPQTEASMDRSPRVPIWSTRTGFGVQMANVYHPSRSAWPGRTARRSLA